MKAKLTLPYTAIILQTEIKINCVKVDQIIKCRKEEKRVVLGNKNHPEGWFQFGLI